MTDHTRLDQQLRFVVELDKLKSVARRTLLVDRSRHENTAEHSWHIALMASLLLEHADDRAHIDVCRVTQMLLVHDVVEIDAGDTYCYDASANLDKPTRERAAATRLFGLLPPDQSAHFRALWEEFESNTTPDSRYANALDRLQPLLNNYHTQGEAWLAHHVTADQVRHRMSPLATASTSLAQYATTLIADAVQRGYVLPDKR